MQAASYQEKKFTPAQIAQQLQDGDHIFSDIALAEPKEIFKAIGDRVEKKDLHDVTLNNMLDLYPLPCYDMENSSRFRGVSWFCGPQARKAANRGYGDVMPAYYRDFPRLTADTQDVDVMVAAVSPMDKHGYFSFSTVGSVTEEYLKKAKRIYLEVNDQLPRAVCAPQIHVSRVDGFCETSYPLPVAAPSEPDPVSQKIGAYIAEQIPDGATLQLGIGAIPDAVGAALKDKKHLGIHTEMFTDSMVELLECGAADNSLKPLYRGRTVATFAYGSKRIYDYIDDNPSFVFLPVNFVNDPRVIAQHPNFMSINAALQVDFYGQVCAESLGSKVVSGTGGQTDYVRGAVLSPGGKSFIAFPSTAKHGTISRIVPELSPGALVSTSKNDVDYIVTEYGIAHLRGKTVSQRVKALIQIAHPKFREELTEKARQENLLL